MGVLETRGEGGFRELEEVVVGRAGRRRRGRGACEAVGVRFRKSKRWL